MARSAAQIKYHNEREARFVQYIKDGVTVEDIAHIEGMDLKQVARLRTQYALKHGLKIVKGRRMPTPYGLDGESMKFRRRLGVEVYNLINYSGMERGDLAYQLGIGYNLMNEAYDHYRYDWKLSQVQRLAKILGLSFDELMTKMLTGSTNG